MIEELRESMQRNATERRNYSRELFSALDSSNYEIARFIVVDNWAMLRRNIETNRTSHPVYFRRYILTDEYRFGHGFELAAALYDLGGGYGHHFAELMPATFQPDFLNAIMEPHYTRDAASIFGADSDARSAENKVLVDVARHAAIQTPYHAQVLFVICKWFLTKLLEFGHDARLRPFPPQDDSEGEPEVMTASDVLYDYLEPLVLDEYLTAYANLPRRVPNELTPLLCDAVHMSRQFRHRVGGHTLLFQHGWIDATSICRFTTAEETPLPPPPPPPVDAPPVGGNAYEVHRNFDQLDLSRVRSIIRAPPTHEQTASSDRIDYNEDAGGDGTGPLYVRMRPVLVQLAQSSDEGRAERARGWLATTDGLMQMHLNASRPPQALREQHGTALFLAAVDYLAEQPEKFQDLYFDNFIRDCLTAYNGNSTAEGRLSCTKGVWERAVTALGQAGGLAAQDASIQKDPSVAAEWAVLAKDLHPPSVETQRHWLSRCITDGAGDQNFADDLRRMPRRARETALVACVHRNLGLPPPVPEDEDRRGVHASIRNMVKEFAPHMDVEEGVDDEEVDTGGGGAATKKRRRRRMMEATARRKRPRRATPKPTSRRRRRGKQQLLSRATRPRRK